jgi:hypothetical protein
MGFSGFFKFYIFYENNTNFSLSNRFFMNNKCSTTGKPTRSFATERVSLDSV